MRRFLTSLGRLHFHHWRNTTSEYEWRVVFEECTRCGKERSFKK